MDFYTLVVAPSSNILTNALFYKLIRFFQSFSIYIVKLGNFIACKRMFHLLMYNYPISNSETCTHPHHAEYCFISSLCFPIGLQIEIERKENSRTDARSSDGIDQNPAKSFFMNAILN